MHQAEGIGLSRDDIPGEKRRDTRLRAAHDVASPSAAAAEEVTRRNESRAARMEKGSRYR